MLMLTLDIYDFYELLLGSGSNVFSFECVWEETLLVEPVGSAEALIQQNIFNIHFV